MKKSFSSPRFITYSHTHLHLHEKWTPMLNAIHSCHFTLKLCSLVFSIIMTMIPPHDQMSCSHFSIRCYCYVVGSRRLMPLDALQHKAYCTTLVFSRSYLHHQVSPPETLVVKGGTTWPVISTESCNFHTYTFGFFYMLQKCIMGQTKACWGFFRPEKSDGFSQVRTRELGYQRPARYL